MIRSALAAAMLAMTALSGQAAQIEAGGNPDAPVIAITGEIKQEDADIFQEKTQSLNAAVVLLKSNGGNLVAAIQIGETIRSKGFRTAVTEYCMSACTSIWLAGATRYMTARARMGFHQAYRGDTRQVSGSGNALVGSYLTRLGLGYAAILYATSAGPDEMKWMTPDDAAKLGVAVSVLDPNQDLTQLAIPRQAPVVVRSALAARPAVPQRTLGQQAVKFVDTLVESLNSDSFGNTFDYFYSDVANYYGQMVSKQDILNDKLTFMASWPNRNYKVRTAIATCNAAGTECSVTGVLDWQASNANRHSIGSASFEYVVRRSGMADDSLKIAGETSKVLKRHLTSMDQTFPLCEMPPLPEPRPDADDQETPALIMNKPCRLANGDLVR